MSKSVFIEIIIVPFEKISYHRKNKTKINRYFVRSKFHADSKAVLIFVLAAIVFHFYSFKID